MLSDIEIAKQAKMLKIGEVAAKLGISEDEYEPYGHYKAKLSESLYAKTKNDPDGKLILVTAINPTPAGEGKTTISVGLAESMNKIGKKAMLALREPSLGPVLVSRAVQLAVDTLRSFLWKTSICTSQEICTL